MKIETVLLSKSNENFLLFSQIPLTTMVKDMYLSNIISDYTRKVIQALNQPEKGVPEFRI